MVSIHPGYIKPLFFLPIPVFDGLGDLLMPAITPQSTGGTPMAAASTPLTPGIVPTAGPTMVLAMTPIMAPTAAAQPIKPIGGDLDSSLANLVGSTYGVRMDWVILHTIIADSDLSRFFLPCRLGGGKPKEVSSVSVAVHLYVPVVSRHLLILSLIHNISSRTWITQPDPYWQFIWTVMAAWLIRSPLEHNLIMFTLCGPRAVFINREEWFTHYVGWQLFVLYRDNQWNEKKLTGGANWTLQVVPTSWGTPGTQMVALAFFLHK